MYKKNKKLSRKNVKNMKKRLEIRCLRKGKKRKNNKFSIWALYHQVAKVCSMIYKYTGHQMLRKFQILLSKSLTSWITKKDSKLSMNKKKKSKTFISKSNYKHSPIIKTNWKKKETNILHKKCTKLKIKKTNIKKYTQKGKDKH
jgi:hypothetical protein